MAITIKGIIRLIQRLIQFSSPYKMDRGKFSFVRLVLNPLPSHLQTANRENTISAGSQDDSFLPPGRESCAQSEKYARATPHWLAIFHYSRLFKILVCCTDRKEAFTPRLDRVWPTMNNRTLEPTFSINYAWTMRVKHRGT